MSKKHHGGPAPVPPGNRSDAGPAHTATDDDAVPPPNAENGAEFNDQDEKKRLGGYQTAGEHARQQPGPLNDG